MVKDNIEIVVQINGNVKSFFFNDTATTEIYTLSLHDALPILRGIKRNPRPVLRFEFGVVAVGRSGSDWIPGVVLLYDCGYGSGSGRGA